MTDSEIERMTLCLAQMAATLKAADMSRGTDYAQGKGWIQDDAEYVRNARGIYDLAANNVAGPAPEADCKCGHDAGRHDGNQGYCRANVIAGRRGYQPCGCPRFASRSTS